MAITAVWIEGLHCLQCLWLRRPEVFQVTEETCMIREEVRVDGQLSENEDEKSPLKGAIGDKVFDAIEEAAEGCPVEVIKFTTDD